MMTKHQQWLAAKRKNPGRCSCGRPGVRLKDGHEAVCAICAHRLTGLLVIHRRAAARKPLKGPPSNRGLVARMVDAFETNGRGWGTWDAFLQQHPELD